MKAYVLTCVSLMFAMAAVASSGPVYRASKRVEGEYIIRLQPGVVAFTTKATNLAARYGGRAVDFVPSIQAALVEMTDAQAQALNQDALVREVEENGVGTLATTSPETGLQNPPTPNSRWNN